MNLSSSKNYIKEKETKIKKKEVCTGLGLAHFVCL
jgi:hypothetical protein